MENRVLSKKAGRPRGFCPEEALETALQLFQRKGYEGTSMSDLTEAIGVNRPSLYTAFGSKEELFRKALDLYTQRQDTVLTAALAQPTAHGVAEALLLGYLHDPFASEAPGCLLVQGALACSDEGNGVRYELSRRREVIVEMLRRRFEQAHREGDLPADIRPADMARYVVTVMNGMSVQAAGGAGADDLQRVAEVALRAWPENARR